ncbi:inositol polyphosphate-5-phosphatase A isoform X2 [Callorhinchus milii]|uniref:inositol-polyphosphate 5-phosphatase n=1 Tax=Callorhinchus milii TaxID=7868 RepID=A0A4W3K6D1_CALMI|nr:inositol polyphosphate-5-phosphatase A isoform X2 [Callorhinchus milii]XP_042200489.1 inositol polyphosphate-5-phosphatase A isoform X2 [Callorhinchus milii]|eukprot:gi/632981102/ref/XP_007907405.1/ PREDICTED: type I inositol 1,4,5-trisphosphate 5-phosphatase-like isoform X2 [Callorhinchus milii]
MDLLLVTSNVGSLFDNVDGLQTVWLNEFYQTVITYKPQFIALHCQEVGGKWKGKEYENHMVLVDIFVKEILSSPEMREYNRARVYLDKDFTAHDHFTALGSIYLLHESIHRIRQFDFKAQKYEEVCGKEVHVDDLETNSMIEKERFPQSFWPDFKWSRKGYIRSRWNINDCVLDLVNIHLFHDASNLAAWTTSPSIFSGNRHKALGYILSRITDARYEKVPFFIFGDFNVRLDTKSVVETLCSRATMEPAIVHNTEPGDVKKLIFQERDNNRKVLLRIESKTFEYFDQDVFRENNGKALLEFDKELLSFSDKICELDIHFPPSYPYSEVSTEGTLYSNTRCPAWCDRILMSPSANEIVAKGNHMYDLMGSEVCMGDHKPVFLYFQITP